MSHMIRSYQVGGRDSTNAVARGLSAYQSHYDDRPVFIDRLGIMADLAGKGDLLVAERDGVLVMGAPRASTPSARRNFPIEWSAICMLVVAPDVRGQGIGGA